MESEKDSESDETDISGTPRSPEMERHNCQQALLATLFGRVEADLVATGSTGFKNQPGSMASLVIVPSCFALLWQCPLVKLQCASTFSGVAAA
jgi:hypothetical protein